MEEKLINDSNIKILHSSIENIRGIGNKYMAHLRRLNCNTAYDLIMHLPTSIIDRTQIKKIRELREGDMATQIVTVKYHNIPRRGSKSPYEIICNNIEGEIRVTYFHIQPSMIAKLFPIDKQVLISGKVTRSFGKVSMAHPDIVTTPDKLHLISRLEPQYPLTYGLTSRHLNYMINTIIMLLQEPEEWLPSSLIQKWQLPDWLSALKEIHNPTNIFSLQPYSRARIRLALDEIIAYQISIALNRKNKISVKRNAHTFTGDLMQSFLSLLEFKLTDSQIQVLEEITQDQRSNIRMARMIQGDVGSGKTVIAICAMLNIVESGFQTCFMAPTELLVKQHYNKVRPLLEQLGIKTILLTKDLTNIEKRCIQQMLENGEAQVIIGTHALFQNQIKFNKLGLIVIDEQHRFGVEQRLELLNKGDNVDLIMMSATPIPRTLNMIAYGDMNISVVKHKPQNRQKIVTTSLHISKIDKLVERLGEQILKGEKIYWICPLVTESEKIMLTDIENRYRYLIDKLQCNIEVIHGKMKPQDRDQIMEKFISNEVRLLIATTVIEVGVDVPDASIIVIEHAENFGLAQLHQLRGRVGRGQKQSYCILLYHKLYGDNARRRIAIMCNSEDGFYIAEQDLLLRGAGDIIGNNQTGLPSFKCFMHEQHGKILMESRQIADEILKASAITPHIAKLLYYYRHHNILSKIFI